MKETTKNAMRATRLKKTQERERLAGIATRKKAGYTPELLLKNANLSAWLTNRLILRFGSMAFSTMQIKDFTQYTADYLLSIPTFGQKCLREVNDLLFMSELPKL